MKHLLWFVTAFVAHLFLLTSHSLIYAATSCPDGHIWSITDFGANGSDDKDDYDAFLTASKCASNKPNITLYFPAGHYYIKKYRITGVTQDGRQPNGVANIVFSKTDGLKIIGAGSDKTIIDVQGDYHMTADQQKYDGVDGHDRSYSMSVIPFYFNGVQNFYLGGFEIDGNFDQTTVARSIWQPHTSMGVFVTRSSDFTVADINVHHFAEDGVYLGGGALTDKNTGALLYRVNSHHNGRQGISITNARGVAVVDSSFTDTGRGAKNGGTKGFPPGCGVDIEPVRDDINQPENRTGDILFIQCRYGNNAGTGAAGYHTPDVCSYPNEIGRPYPLYVKKQLDITQSATYPLTPLAEGRCTFTMSSDFSNFYFCQNWCAYGNLENNTNLDDRYLVKDKIKINFNTSDLKTIQYFIDNQPVTKVVPASSDIYLDTTQYTNGKHALSAVATANSGTKEKYKPIVLIIINLPDIPTVSPTLAPTPKPTSTKTPTPTSPPSALCQSCPGTTHRSSGDANCDGATDVLDFSIWQKEYFDGHQGVDINTNWSADFTCDSLVDVLDFSVWQKNFSQ